MRDEQHGRSGIRGAADGPPQALLGRHVEGARGLVEREHAGAGSEPVQRAGHRHPLRLAAGEPRTLHAEFVVGIQLGRGGVGERGAHSVAVRMRVAERHVRRDRAADQPRPLPGPSEPVRRIRIRHTGDAHRPVVGRRTAECGEQAGLAGSAGSLDERDGAGICGEADGGKGLLPVSHGEIAEDQTGAGTGR